MGTTNSTLSSDFSVNISNIIRLFIVTQIELPNILRELLFVKVPPTSLEGLIHKNVYLSSLRAFELGVIATVRTKQYADFDVALMYKIIRNLELVKEPTQGWDKNPPTPTETTIGDDVERIRRSRNDFAHNVNSNISDIELNNRFSLFIDIASRLEVYMNKHNREYVSKIEKVKVCCIDPETEQMYLRQLEILIERETIMQSNMSAVSNSVDELRHQSNIRICNGCKKKCNDLIPNTPEENECYNEKEDKSKQVCLKNIEEDCFDSTSEGTQFSQHLSQISNWSDTIDTNTLEVANEVIDLASRGKSSPLRGQLRTNIDEAKLSTIRYYKRKAEESVDSVLNLIAPGQSQELKKLIMPEMITSKTPTESDLTNSVLKLYEETTNSNLKSQILSVIARKMTKQELLKHIPDLTVYKIDQARLLSVTQGITIPEKVKQPRSRMDQVKLQHALDFFFDPCFVQIVSFGTRNINLDTGEHITIPDVARTSCHSQIIQMYEVYCKDTAFEPLGRSTLFYILKACAASKRTNLHGLDNIAAEGVEGYQALHAYECTDKLKEINIISTEQHTELSNMLTASKVYMKTDFRLHVQESDMCADHCIKWSLSDPKDENFQSKCNHTHSLHCDRCQILKEIELKLKILIANFEDTDLKEEHTKRLSDATTQIYNWKSHIVRTVNQDRFRINMLESLETHQAMLVMDWAMKFLPLKYREKQTDWFGQRGKNWHVTVCIFKDQENAMKHKTFTHVLDSAKQDWLSVTSLLENVLVTMKEQLPHITEIMLRSDNAGCYHCGHMWLCLPEIIKQTGIQIKHYCYSEPQAGKSYCDSKIAHMRTKMKTYVANGNNNLSASDMKTALDFGIDELGLSGLKTKLSTLQTEQEEAIPKNVRDQLNKNTEEWKIKDIKFVPTRASEYVSDQLNKKSCVTLTGSPGMGKTFLARHIALDFQLEGYMIVPVLTPTDIRDYYLPGKQTIFVVDDVCGKFIANQSQLEIWQQMLPKIEQILADDSCKIIATCRLQVYRDDKINLLEPFKICECNLNSKEMCLTQSEKIKIKEKYFGNRNLDDIAQASDFFPLLCSLQWLPEEEGIDVSNLFKSPFEFYKKELDNLYRCGDDGKKKICSLVLCVLFNNFLEIKWFDGRVTDEQRQVLDDVFMACRLNTGTPKTELMDALDTLDGSLVSKGNLTYSTIHDKIFDFLAHYFGGTMIQCLINHSHHNLINERFKWKNSKNISTNEFAIALTDESLKWYLDRLVNDWSHGKVSTVIANSNMNDESFRYKFISFVKELKKTQQEKLANTRDTLQKKEWSTSGSYPIINASFEGYIDIVRWLLDNAVDVNQCRDDGNTSLYMACHNGHKDIVSLLLKKNHFINVFNEIRVTPLFIACEKGYTEIVEALLKHNADVNINMIDGDINLSPLFQATSKGHYDIMKKLLEKNADVNTYDTYGSTPLLLACERGNMEMVRLLISNKANVEMRTYIGASAITVASANGNIEITRFLLESNADVNSCIHRKELISFKAMIRPSKTLENLKENIFNFVLEKGKPRVQQYVRLKSKEYVFDIMAGSSPLHIACCLGHFEIVECLLQYNASVNLTKADGTTPLFYACQLGYDSIVRLLLDKGADTKLCRDDGKSPHALARENGYTYIEKKLRKHSKSNKSLTQ